MLCNFAVKVANLHIDYVGNVWQPAETKNQFTQSRQPKTILKMPTIICITQQQYNLEGVRLHVRRSEEFKVLGRACAMKTSIRNRPRRQAVNEKRRPCSKTCEWISGRQRNACNMYFHSKTRKTHGRHNSKSESWTRARTRASNDRQNPSRLLFDTQSSHHLSVGDGAKAPDAPPKLRQINDKPTSNSFSARGFYVRI